MSARSSSRRLALGGVGLQERALARVPRQQQALIADPEGIVRELMDEHGTADVVRAVPAGGQLGQGPLEAHGTVVARRAPLLGGGPRRGGGGIRSRSKLTVLSLRPVRSCWRESTSRRSTPTRRRKALSGWAGCTVKRRLKSGTNVAAGEGLAGGQVGRPGS